MAVYDLSPSAQTTLSVGFSAGPGGEPFANRNAKAGLGARENSAGQGPERCLQHRSLAGRSTICHPFSGGTEQFNVDQREANFQRVRHSRPIRIAEKLVAHVPAGFQTGQPGTGRADSSDVAFDDRDGLQLLPALASEIVVQDFRQFPWHKQSSPQEIGARITSTVLEKSRIFRRSPMFKERRRHNPEAAAQRFQRLEGPESLHEPGNFPEAWISSEKFVSSKS